MSMNATDSALSAFATFRATVDFPDPEPPAMPMINGFIDESRSGGSHAHQIAEIARSGEAVTLSQSGTGRWRAASFFLWGYESCNAGHFLCSPRRPGAFRRR